MSYTQSKSYLKKVAANIGLSEIVEELERGHDWTVFWRLEIIVIHLE